MTENEWWDLVRLSSIPLRRIGPDLMPTASASGCLTQYEGKRLILTVQHATGDMQDWAVEERYDPNRGARLYRLSAMNYLAKVDLQSLQDPVDVDFAYVEVPKELQPIFQQIDVQGNIQREEKRGLCVLDLDTEPDTYDEYGFSGQVRTDRTGSILMSDHGVYTGLNYTKTDGDYYVFRLPVDHPGHEYFEGCSGAPILNRSGKAIALVCHGVIETNSIYGLALKKYKIALDASFGDLSRVK